MGPGRLAESLRDGYDFELTCPIVAPGCHNVIIGRYHDVFETLVNESEHGWVNMIREGATTYWEAWGRDQKWNTSLCHAWAAAPIPVLIKDIAGMVPDPSKKEGFRFEPHVPRELESFDLWVPFHGIEWHIHKDAKNGEVVCHNKGVIKNSD